MGYENPGPITVGDTLSMFEMDLSGCLSGWGYKAEPWEGWAMEDYQRTGKF